MTAAPGVMAAAQLLRSCYGRSLSPSSTALLPTVPAAAAPAMNAATAPQVL